MSFESRNRDFVKEETITKRPRTQVDTDNRDNPVYDYLSSDYQEVEGVISYESSDQDKDRDSSGQKETGRLSIDISDQITVTPHTRWEIGGIVYSTEQRRPARQGTRKILLQRLQT